MKKENVTVAIDGEKLRAIKRYMARKNASVEKELTDAIEKLYEKFVPAQVREYIDDSAEDTKPNKPTIRPKEIADKDKVETKIM